MVNGGEAPSRQLEVQRGDDASLARFGRSLRSCLASDSSEFLSIFWSGALAGLVLEAAIHTTYALQARLQQLRQGHTFGTLGLKWWITAVASQPPKGPFRGAAGTLAAGTIWSGIFGSCFVPVRAAVDATAAEAGREDGGGWAPAAGAAAGALAASSVRVPLQVVRERMRRREFFCSLQAFELILTREGPAALYKGWLSSLRAVPFDAMLFMLYDKGKRRVLDPGSGQATNEHAATGLGESGATGVAAATAGPAGAAAAGVEARGPTDCSGSCTQGARPAPGAAPSEGAGAAESLAPPYRWWQAALVGGAAGAATGLVTSPLEAVRAAGAEATSGASTASAGPAASPSVALHSRGGRGRFAAFGRALAGGVRSRVAWCAMEGAVFFPALEAAIPLCDWAFGVGLAEEGTGAGAGAGPGGAGEDGGAGGGEAWARQQAHRHPAHPLHW